MRGQAASTSAERRILGKAGLNNGKSAPAKRPAQPSITCPECGSPRIWKDGFRYVKTETAELPIQRYLCRDCGLRFSESTAQPQVKLNVSSQVVECVHSDSKASENDVVPFNLSFKEAVDSFSFPRRKDVGSHVQTTPARAILAKPLSILLRQNSPHRVCVSEREAKNLVGVETQQKAMRGATTKPTPAEIQKGKIIEWLWHLKKKGLADITIYGYNQKLKQLTAKCDLFNPETIKEFIAKKKCSKRTKAIFVMIYNEFAKWLKLEWEPPIYKPVRKLPFIPTEAELDQLIAAAGPRLATFLQLLKETGVREGEAIRLLWTDIDFERKIVQINAPEKGSNPRILPLSNKLIGMLQRVPRKWDKVFSFSMSANFYIQRKKIARKLNNPRIRKIHLHTFRHWKGTMEYHKTRDIIHVQQILGHRDIKSTMLYINVERAIFQGSNDEFHVAVAKTVQEACELVEVGFEKADEYNGVHIYRKRK